MLAPAFRLPPRARRDFSRPRGTVYSGDITPVLERVGEPLICVGDVVSQYCSRAGKKHVVIIVDGKTRRSVSLQEGVPTDYNVVRVRNPPGTITVEAHQAVCRAADERGRWAIVVDGEEDMLALPSIACLHRGGTVVYGVPHRGATLIRVGLETSREAQARFLELSPSLIRLE